MKKYSYSAAFLFLLIFPLRGNTPPKGHAEEWDQLVAQATQLEKRGLYLEAVPMLQHALALSEGMGASDLIEKSLDHLSALFLRHHDPAAAEKIILRQVAIYQQRQDRRQFALASASLARCYSLEGQQERAENLCRHHIDFLSGTLTERNDTRMACLSTLAGVEAARGHYSQADTMYRQLVSAREKLGPPDAPLAADLSSLGAIRFLLGDYDEAERLQKRGLAIVSNAETHRAAKADEVMDTAKTGLQYRLAEVYLAQQHYSKSAELLSMLIPVWESSLGPEHPDVAAALIDLATALYWQSKFDEAERLLMRALNICEKALQPRDPEIASALNLLAAIKRSRRNFPEAEELYLKAVSIEESHFKVSLNDRQLASDLFLARTLNNLAELYCVEGRYTESEASYLRALKVTEQSVGARHRDFVFVLTNYVYLLKKMHRRADARRQRARLESIREEMNVSDVGRFQVDWRELRKAK
jgi:tetratricopeptide (TPR) repeat protein